MTWATVATVGASLVGGLMGSRSSQKAAETQAAAAQTAAQTSLQAGRESNALTRDIYLQTLRNQAPQLYGGQVAQSALLSAMGLGPSRALPGGAGSNMTPAGTFTNAEGMPTDARGVPITDLTGGLGGMNVGADQAALDAAGQPYAGALQEQFTGQDIYRDPSYQFRVDEGMRALRAQQAAGGNRFGGQSMKDIVNYGQGAASQEFGNAYSRFRQQKQDLYDRLAGLTGGAATAAGAAGAAGTAAGGQMSQNLMGSTNAANQALIGGSNALASGQVGSTNAIVGGLQGAADNWMMMNLLKQKPSGMGD